MDRTSLRLNGRTRRCRSRFERLPWSVPALATFLAPIDTLRELRGITRDHEVAEAAIELAESGEFKLGRAIATSLGDPRYKMQTLDSIEIIRRGGERPSQRGARTMVPEYREGPAPKGMAMAARLLKQARAEAKLRAFDKAARDLAAALSAVASVKSSDFFRDIEGTGLESRSGLIAAIGEEQTRAGAFADALETARLLRMEYSGDVSVKRIVRKTAWRQTLAGQSRRALEWTEELPAALEKTHALIGIAEGMIQLRTGARVRMRINYPYKDE